MKIFNARKLRSKNLPGILELAGKECALICFRDDCHTTTTPAFIGQLRNTITYGKQVLHITGSTMWGDADVNDRIDRQIRQADPEQIGVVVADHWRQLLVTEDDDQAVLSLKYYFDNLASEIKIPLIVVYRYSL